MTTEHGENLCTGDFERLPQDLDIPLVTLLNEISKMPDDSLLLKITTYCDENDYREEDVAEILKDSDQFKRALWLSCVDNHQIKDDQVQDLFENTNDLDCW